MSHAWRWLGFVGLIICRKLQWGPETLYHSIEREVSVSLTIPFIAKNALSTVFSYHGTRISSTSGSAQLSEIGFEASSLVARAFYQIPSAMP